MLERIRKSDIGQLVQVLVIAVPIVLLVSCVFSSDRNKSAAPVVKPYPGAPVTAEIDGKTLILTNNSQVTIYQRTFPTEILAVIEWAPCLAPEVCSEDSRIESGEERRTKLSSIVQDETESITVYWWHYLEKVPGAGIPPMEMEEFTISLP